MQTPFGQRSTVILGILVFIAGVAIIVAMVWFGYEIYRTPQLGLSLPASGTPSGTGSPSPAAPSMAQHGVELGLLVLRFGILALGVLAGSLIARKGTQLIGAR